MCTHWDEAMFHSLFCDDQLYPQDITFINAMTGCKSRELLKEAISVWLFNKKTKLLGKTGNLVGSEFFSLLIRKFCTDYMRHLARILSNSGVL